MLKMNINYLIITNITIFKVKFSKSLIYHLDLFIIYSLKGTEE